MTTFEQWRAPGRIGLSRLPRPPKKYDTRVVDQFYAYCLALARAQRHRDEAHAHARALTRRGFWIALVAGSTLFHYLLERLAQAIALL